jgi:hypothetical protein
MSSIRSTVMISLAIVTLAGCSSGGDGPSGPAAGGASSTRPPGSPTGTQTASVNNYESCKKYVESVNGLPCMKGAAAKLDAEQSCGGWKQQTTCDASKYFDCVRDAYKCKDVAGTSVPDATGVQSCAQPACK